MTFEKKLKKNPFYSKNCQTDNRYAKGNEFFHENNYCSKYQSLMKNRKKIKFSNFFEKFYVKSWVFIIKLKIFCQNNSIFINFNAYGIPWSHSYGKNRELSHFSLQGKDPCCKRLHLQKQGKGKGRQGYLLSHIISTCDERTKPLVLHYI